MSAEMRTDETAVPSIPVISLAGDPAQVAKEVGAACEQVGFLVVIDHGVPQRHLADLYAVTQDFFGKDLAYKRRASASPPHPYNGYTHPSDTRADGDQLEKYECCSFDTREDMAAAGYSGKYLDQLMPNIWPDDEFRQVWQRHLRLMHSVGDHLMGLMSIALDMPRGYLPGKCAGACSFAVANHYWPAPATGDVKPFRLPGHTDIEALTLLYRPALKDGADEGGIQVHVRDGEWEEVPVVPDSFIVNLGDMMAHWTDGRFRATPHRVRNGAERYSFPFFHGPRKDEMLEPIPSCSVPGQPPKWEPVAAGDWTEKQMSRPSISKVTPAVTL